jgi:hypothetical protein
MALLLIFPNDFITVCEVLVLQAIPKCIRIFSVNGYRRAKLVLQMIL